jgi:hypothetical protein
MKTRRHLTLSLTVLALLTAGQSTVSAEETLPQVLIIGDSISLGYTPYVIRLLEGKADVIHHRGNAGPTIRGIDDIEDWLGSTQWNVIHFNWGLWDMYGWQYEDQDRSPKAYGERLNTLVLRLKKTEAKLIWATTTPACPEAEKKCLVTVDAVTEREYLATARRVMKKHHVQINDLHSFMEPKWAKYAIAGNNVHYRKDGYRQLAEQVSKQIQLALKREAIPSPSKEQEK